MADKPSVLFVCVHNAGRSQMAAGYLNHLAGGRIDVRSAGSEPADKINPVAVQAMAEAASTSPPSNPRFSLPTPSKPPTSSSPWDAATPAPTIPANAMKIGHWKIPPVRISRQSAESATRSAATSKP